MVFQLAYVSTAAAPWARLQLLELLGRSRASNATNDVTGMLLYRGDRFLQLLEGERSCVTELYGRIAVDRRHQDVTTVLARRRLTRQFASWTMAFRDLGSEPIDVPGFSHVLDPDADEAMAPAATRALVDRLRPARSVGRPVVHGSRVLGLVSGTSAATATL